MSSNIIVNNILAKPNMGFKRDDYKYWNYDDDDDEKRL
jgi:hypothetical protein